MGEIEFFARKGSRISHKDAQIVGPVLTSMDNPTRADIVDVARDVESPLHRFFEWDDSHAAEQFRQHQAGVLAASIRVRITRAEDMIEAPAFFTAPVRILFRADGEEGEKRREPERIISIQQVSADEHLATFFVREAYRELLSWRDRFLNRLIAFEQHAEKFRPVLESIEEIEAHEPDFAILAEQRIETF